jgi:peptidoglycan/LPS O-acetylase OafA/YrhL
LNSNRSALGVGEGNADHRLNNFDALRLFASMLVLYGHAYALVGAPGPSFASNGVATIGVKIFFVISGYLVIESWLRDPHPLRYIERRALRIWPAFIAVVLISALVIGPSLSPLSVAAYYADPLTWNYLRNIFFYIGYTLPGLFAHNVYPMAVNGSLWTLPVEISMYLVVPVLLGCLAPLGPWRLPLFLAATVTLSTGALVFLRMGPMPVPIVIYATNFWNWLELAPYFMIGTAAALARANRLLDINVALMLVMMTAMAGRGPLVEEAMLMLALPYAVLSFGLGWSPLLGRFARYGDLSYGLFLWGFFVQQIVVSAIGVRGGALTNFALSLVIATPLAFASWHLLEKHALALKPRARRPGLTTQPPLRVGVR